MAKSIDLKTLSFNENDDDLVTIENIKTNNRFTVRKVEATAIMTSRNGKEYIVIDGKLDLKNNIDNETTVFKSVVKD